MGRTVVESRIFLVQLKFIQIQESVMFTLMRRSKKPILDTAVKRVS